MYKSYILSIVGFLAGIAAVVYLASFYQKDRPDEDYEISFVFNKATIGSKLAGKTYDQVAQEFLPATEVLEKNARKLNSGNFSARYDKVKVFSKGSKDVIRSMTLEYKDSVVVKIALGEPTPSKDAKWVNLSPLSYKMMDWGWGTRDRELKDKDSARGWQIPVFLLLLLILVLLPFFFLWPLGVWLVKKMEGLGVVIYVAVLLVALWLFDGFIAYSNGSTVLFLVLQAVALAITIRSMGKANKPQWEPTFSESGTSSAPRSSSSICTKQEYVGHLCNLAYLMACVGLDGKQDPQSEKRARVVVDTMSQYGVHLTTDEFQYCMEHPRDTDNVSVPSNPAIRAEFVQDFFRFLASDETIPITSVKLAIVTIYAKKLGEPMELTDAMKRIVDVAQNEYGYTFTGDNFAF